MTKESNKLIDLPYISFGKKHDPNKVKNRQYVCRGEVMRVYYYEKQFVFTLSNKKKDMAGWGCASEIVRLVKNKYYRGKFCDMNFVYPEGFKHKEALLNLVTEHTDEAMFEKRLYQYLILLI